MFEFLSIIKKWNANIFILRSKGFYNHPLNFLFIIHPNILYVQYIYTNATWILYLTQFKFEYS